MGMPYELKDVRALERVAAGEDDATRADFLDMGDDAHGFRRIDGPLEILRPPAVRTLLVALRRDVEVDGRDSVRHRTGAGRTPPRSCTAGGGFKTVVTSTYGRFEPSPARAL